MSMDGVNVKTSYQLETLSENDYNALSVEAKRDYKNELLYTVDEINLDIKSCRKELKEVKRNTVLKEKIVRKYGVAKAKTYFEIVYLQKVLKAFIPLKYVKDTLPSHLIVTRIQTFYNLYTTKRDIILNYLQVDFNVLCQLTSQELYEKHQMLLSKLDAAKNQFKAEASVPNKDYVYNQGIVSQGELAQEIEAYQNSKAEHLSVYKALPKLKIKRDKRFTFITWLLLSLKDRFHLFFWKQRNFFGIIKDNIKKFFGESYHNSTCHLNALFIRNDRLSYIENYLVNTDTSFNKGDFIDFDALRNKLESKVTTLKDLIKVRSNELKNKVKEDAEYKKLDDEKQSFVHLIAQLPPRRKVIVRREKTATFFKKWGQALIYVGPVLFLLGVFSFYPIFNAIRMSLLTGYKHADGSYTGLSIYKNFYNVLTAGTFVKPSPGTPSSALINTFVVTFISVPLSILIALGIAAALSSIKPLKSAFQTIFFLPYITNSLAIGLVFAYIFQDRGGLFNKFLSIFGINGGAWITHGTNYYKSMFVLIVFSIWHGLAFKIMVFLSAIESIDKQYYQAAQIDKTPKWRQFWRITMPLISPTVFYIVITSLIGGLKTYTSVIAIFGQTGGPDGAQFDLKTVVFYIYDFFQFPDRFPEASAGSIILFGIILLFTIVQMQVGKRRVHY